MAIKFLNLRVISLIAALLVCVPSFAEGYSGYLGKHYAVHYDFFVSPSLTQPVRSSEPHNDVNTLIGFNGRHCFELEIMRNKRMSFAPVLHIMKTSFAVNSEYRYLTDNVSSSGDFSSPSQTTKTHIAISDSYFFGKLNAYSFGVSGTYYPKAMNPIGGYFKMEVFRVNYKTKNVFSEDKYFTTDDDVFIDDRYFTYGTTLQVGMQKIYFDLISLRYGMQVGWVVGGNLTNLDSGNAVFCSANRRLRALYDFNLNIGVGYLLY